jgi:hypothetical protein
VDLLALPPTRVFSRQAGTIVITIDIWILISPDSARCAEDGRRGC